MRALSSALIAMAVTLAGCGGPGAPEAPEPTQPAVDLTEAPQPGPECAELEARAETIGAAFERATGPSGPLASTMAQLDAIAFGGPDEVFKWAERVLVNIAAAESLTSAARSSVHDLIDAGCRERGVDLDELDEFDEIFSELHSGIVELMTNVRPHLGYDRPSADR